mmetsp:Transcript_41124/g.92616  ORF Transcript_41124/g.92616 Transcript_41124/m.92616 type:complete len:219 (-) Transcript_41124:96-752(-)
MCLLVTSGSATLLLSSPVSAASSAMSSSAFKSLRSLAAAAMACPASWSALRASPLSFCTFLRSSLSWLSSKTWRLVSFLLVGWLLGEARPESTRPRTKASSPRASNWAKLMLRAGLGIPCRSSSFVSGGGRLMELAMATKTIGGGARAWTSVLRRSLEGERSIDPLPAPKELLEEADLADHPADPAADARPDPGPAVDAHLKSFAATRAALAPVPTTR